MSISDTLAIGSDVPTLRLGLGTMSLTGAGVWGEPSDRDSAKRLLRKAVELGVTFIDTADSYGPEVSELLIAEALHPYPGGLIIATKGGLRRRGPGDWYRDARPEHLRKTCEESLRRLRLDRIDLYQLHAIDPQVPLEESLGLLTELREEGKVRQIGVCNVDVAQLDRIRAAAEIVSVQNRFSLADRASGPLVEACERAGLTFIAWAPLAKAQLARPAGSLGSIAEAHGATSAQIALAWLLHRSPVLLPIPGTASASHLEENLGALSVELSPEEVDRLARFRSFGLEARRLRRSLRGRSARRGTGSDETKRGLM